MAGRMPAILMKGALVVSALACMAVLAAHLNDQAHFPRDPAYSIVKSARASEVNATTIPSWFATKRDKRLKLGGGVPSEEDRKTILGMVKANMPDAEIDDRMKVTTVGGNKQAWLGGVGFALVQLGQLNRGMVRLDTGGLSLEGVARSAESYKALRAAVTTPPNGITLKQAGIQPPKIKPYSWTASFENGALTLTGLVLGEDPRSDLVHKISQLFPNMAVTDRMQVASGAPDEWQTAVLAALAQLSRLEQGKVTITETEMQIDGVARDAALATEIPKTLKLGLPKAFELKDNIRAKPQNPAANDINQKWMRKLPAFFAARDATWPPL